MSNDSIKISTLSGFAMVNPAKVIVSECYSSKFQDKETHELRLLLKDNPMMFVFSMESKQSMLIAIENIEKAKRADSESEISVGLDVVMDDRTYIDGFKDGCEYTLKLK